MAASNMLMLNWNVRGLNALVKRSGVRDMVMATHATVDRKTRAIAGRRTMNTQNYTNWTRVVSGDPNVSPLFGFSSLYSKNDN
jgi:hypothetical protein